jgi:hypothetical protein
MVNMDNNPINIKNTRPKFVGCLRTRNSGKHMSEYLSHHLGVGFTKIELFDDSDIGNNITRDVCMNHPRVEYFDRRGLSITKETQYIEECYRRNIPSVIMALDDDEYIVGNITSVFKKHRNSCAYLPVKFFGTTENKPVTNLTTFDFTHRERNVTYGNDLNKHLKKHKENIGMHLDYLSYRANSNKITRSVYKSIFNLHDMRIFDNESLPNYIHGFHLKCHYYTEDPLWIGHFTRSVSEFDKRISTFWKNIHNRNQRFTGSKTFLKNYKRERNRIDMVDNRLRDLFFKIIT